jgi:hypothetical protein
VLSGRPLPCYAELLRTLRELCALPVCRCAREVLAPAVHPQRSAVFRAIMY